MGYVKKTKTKSEIWLTIVSIILVAVVVASIVTAALSNTGVFLRVSDAVKTENYEVDGAMMNYFFNEELRSWISNNSTYIQYAALYPSYFGDYVVDFTSDLDAQECKLIPEAERTDDYRTWYDYFMGLTVETVSRYIEYAEGANLAGVTLDEEDEKNVKESLNALMSDLKANGYSLEDVYGNGVSKSDIKKCFELKEIAVKYAEIKIEEMKVALEKENTEVFLKYADEHKSDFYSAKYIYYTIQEKEADYKTDAEYESAKAAAKAAADLIASAETPELFFDGILKYEAEKKASETTAATTTAASTTTEAATTKAPEMEDYTKEVFYNTETAELDKWLFEENAEDGDSKVIEETETVTTKATTTTATEETTSGEETTTARTTNEVYKVTAYKVIKSNDLNRDKTFDLGYVVTTDKAIAERILADFNGGSTKTAEALKKLGLAEAEKLGDNSTIGIDAATQENAMPEYFSSFSKDLDKWLNAKDLKAGANSGLVEVLPTADGGSTQYVICQFDDFGDEVWYAEAFDYIMDERFEAWYADMKVQKPISTKAKTLDKMTVSNYVMNMASQAANASTSSVS